MGEVVTGGNRLARSREGLICEESERRHPLCGDFSVIRSCPPGRARAVRSAASVLS
jgi:hypothetical protein